MEAWRPGNAPSPEASAREVTASAPGRVNLLGAQVDDQQRFVLALAIPQRTTVALRARDDAWVEVRTDDVLDPVVDGWALGTEERTGRWADHVQAVTWALRQAGLPLGGFDARITSEVPMGSGLSSSAALEVALLRGIRELFDLDLDDAALARLAHRGEAVFVGAPVGVLDPMACTFAAEDAAMLVDTRTLHTTAVPLPRSVAVAVIDSGQRPGRASSERRERRAQCAEAARLLGVETLRELGAADLPRVAALPTPLDRRARHVVTEDARVLEAVAASEQGDIERLGALLDASHASQRDDFACSTAGIDRLVALARGVPGVLGARLTGEGFGGSVVLLTDAGAADEAAREVVRRAGGVSSLRPVVLVPR